MPPDTQPPISPQPVPGADQPAGPPKRFWNPLSAIGLAALLFVGAQLIASVPLMLYAAVQHWSTDRTNGWLNGTYAQFWYVVLAETVTLAGIWWLTRRGGLRLKDIGWRRFSPWAILYALGGFAVYFISYAILLAIANALVPNLNLKQQQDIGFEHVSGGLELLVTFISLVVLPPLTEETFFRGFLFTSFRLRMGFIASTLLTSVLFAVPHLLESQTPGSLLWVAGIDTFVLSIVLCFLREKTNSLWPGILLHALKNGIAFLSLYVFAVH